MERTFKSLMAFSANFDGAEWKNSTENSRYDFLTWEIYDSHKISFCKTIREWYGCGLKLAIDVYEDLKELHKLNRKNELAFYIKIIARGFKYHNETFSQDDSSEAEKISAAASVLVTNWETLGYANLKEAMIDFLNRL